MANNLIAHVEIPSKDLDKTKEFFQNLFGWEFKAFGNGYSLYNTHKGFTVGLRKVDNVKEGDCTIFHVRVDDINAILNKANKLGGKTFRGKTTIPAFGYYALINDINGNTIGLFQGM